MKLKLLALLTICTSSILIMKPEIDILKHHKSQGGHYLFFNTDSILHQHVYGYANIENGIKVAGNTSFHVFSATKTFTAVATMQLVQAGKIELDKTIETYLPNYKFTQPITIRQLLNHQSGLSNPLPLKWTHFKNEHSDFSFTSFADSLILKYLEVKRTPGKKFAYSNLNYLVLGRLIEEVSGMKYEEYINQNILNKLNTDEYIGFTYPEEGHASGYHPNTILQNLVLGMLLDRKSIMYKVNNKWNGFNPFYVSGTSYGGLFATPKALVAYCQAILKGDELLSNSITSTMLTEQKNNKDKNTGMSLGWFKGNLNGVDYYCHAGGGGGYYVEIRLYPELKKGSVIMTNASGMSDKRILDKIDKEYIHEK